MPILTCLFTSVRNCHVASLQPNKYTQDQNSFTPCAKTNMPTPKRQSNLPCPGTTNIKVSDVRGKSLLLNMASPPTTRNLDIMAKSTMLPTLSHIASDNSKTQISSKYLTPLQSSTHSSKINRSLKQITPNTPRRNESKLLLATPKSYGKGTTLGYDAQDEFLELHPRRDRSSLECHASMQDNFNVHSKKKQSSILRINSSNRSESSSSTQREASSSSFSGTSGSEETVKVCVRIRPLPDNISSDHRAWTVGTTANTIVRNNVSSSSNNNGKESIPLCNLTPVKGGRSSECYHFDRVFGEDTNTQEVYSEMVENIVSTVCQQGRNGTIFTYGQTSTGKTYTMHGIICAAARDIFRISAEQNKTLKEKSHSSLTRIKVSCLELYNEELRDLLQCQATALSIKEDKFGNVLIPNLTEKVVLSVDNLLEVLSEADMSRTVGSTSMNEKSSRSHTIFRITYEKKETKETTMVGSSFIHTDCEIGVECSVGLVESDGNEDKENCSQRCQRNSKEVVTTISTLNLVDLAGSESVRHTNASGMRQKEGGKINQSLLTLSTVLAKLGKKDSSHINYRDSRLTRILKPSLSGNARMSAICCISPAMQFYEESKSTLDFAVRTMLVTTNAKTNNTIEHFKMETANAEKFQQELAASLQKAEEKIICLMATVEFEKSKVAQLERQYYDSVEQIKQLTLQNEELVQQSDSLGQNVDLLKRNEEFCQQNEDLQTKMNLLHEEKNQLEWRLMRELNKARKRKDEALQKRQKFRNTLANMAGKLKEDLSSETAPLDD